MKILIYGLNYFPEKVGIGKYTSEMAEWLSNANHEVKVITSNPYFPQWDIKENSYKKEIIKSVEVYRCILWVPRNPTGIKRIIHLISFSISSIPIMIKQAFWKPDIIFTIAPSFFCAPISILTAKLCRKKVLNWIHLQDLEFDAAFKLGFLKSDILQKIGRFLELLVLNNFSSVSTISNAMLKNLVLKGVKNDKLFLFPNWVDINEIYPIDKFNIKNKYIKKLSINKDQTVIMYSGSLNKKQGVDTLLKLVEAFKDRSDILWIIAGGGTSYKKVKKFCNSYENSICLPLQPRENLNQFLNTADIHLIPQKKEAADLVMPSKLLTILACGKAFIAGSSKESELGKIASQVGIRVDPDNFNNFKNAIEKLINDKDFRYTLGKKSRNYAIENFEKYKILKSLNEKIISEKKTNTKF